MIRKMRNIFFSPLVIYTFMLPIYIFLFVLLYRVVTNDSNIPSSITTSQESIIVKKGGSFIVHYNIERYRSCHVNVQRILKNVDLGFELILAETNRYLDLPSGAVLKENPSINVQLPASLSSGRYVYFSKNHYTCDIYHKIFSPKIIKTPEIKIQIID